MSLHPRFSRKEHDRKASSPKSAQRRSNRVRSRSFLPRYELMLLTVTDFGGRLVFDFRQLIARNARRPFVLTT